MRPHVDTRGTGGWELTVEVVGKDGWAQKHSVCSEFSFMVSGGGGLDCTCIIWDLNTFAPVRSLDRMPGPVVAIAVSNTTVRPQAIAERVARQPKTKA